MHWHCTRLTFWSAGVLPPPAAATGGTKWRAYRRTLADEGRHQPEVQGLIAEPRASLRDEQPSRSARAWAYPLLNRRVGRLNYMAQELPNHKGMRPEPRIDRNIDPSWYGLGDVLIVLVVRCHRRFT